MLQRVASNPILEMISIKLKVMRHYFKIAIAVLGLFGCLLVINCNKEADLGKSDIDTKTPKLSDLDKWLRSHYTKPYNIDVLYEWDENKTDLNRYLTPPDVKNVLPAMKVVKTIWLDSYSEAGGADFVKKIAPREILLIGGVNLNASGTQTLGLAEGGKRITFFRVDLVDLKDKSEVSRFIETIQHEYAHILTQNVPYDMDAYRKITPDDYTAQWFNESVADSRELGYITSYARSNENEDFAEMIATMLSNDRAGYDAIVNAITSADAKANLRKKEKFIVDYYSKNFNIDIYKLQEVVDKNTDKAIK